MKKSLKLSIIGLGYVGLPFLHLVTSKKISCYGFDIDKDKIKKLKKNQSYISDLKNKQIKNINKKNLFLMSNISKIQDSDYIILCLPTPLTKNLKPDLSIIKNVFNKIKYFLRQGQTLILESTVYPGATNEIFFEFLNKKFSLGKNFYYGYSSERISPGQTDEKHFKYKLENIHKVISGFDKQCLKKISFIYKKIFQRLHYASSIEVAEMSKLVENSYRSVNIGLVNELKVVCEKLKINIHEVLDAAKTKPFGYVPFLPGPGVGGHCIPIDPIFISYVSKKKNYDVKFIDLARKINLNITNWIVKKIIKSEKPKKIKLKALIIGVAYKAEINDVRDSPAIKIMNSLLKNNYSVDFYDPYVDKINLEKRHYKSILINKCNQYDFVVICTDHKSLPLKLIKNRSKKIYDTRGVFKNLRDKKIVQC